MTPWERQDERENGACSGQVSKDVFGSVIPRGPLVPLPVVVSYGIDQQTEQKGEGEA